MSADWPIVPLGRVIRHRKEFIEIDDTTEYKRCRVQLHARGVVLRDIVAGVEVKTKAQQVCRAGEFLVAEIDAKIGGFGIVPDDLASAIVSSHYFLFDIDEAALDRRFLYYYIRTPAFQDQVAAQGSTNYAAIRPQHVLNYTIPLPSLADQQRILARIEALATRIEEAKGLRAQAMGEVEAVMGAAASEMMSNSTWQTRAMYDLADVRGGIQKSSKRIPGANARRYLTVAHVQRNWIDTADERYFEVSDDELDRWKLLPGDVLVIEGNGSAAQIGRTALFRGEIQDCVHQNHVIRVRPNRSHIWPEYLNAYLNSSRGQEQMREISRTTSGLFNLSVGRIELLEISLPPLDEQRRIVAHLDDLQLKVDEVKRLQSETQAELAALLPAVLARAFRGEL